MKTLDYINNFETVEGNRFKKNYPFLHNIAVFLFIALFFGGIMGAAYVIGSKTIANVESRTDERVSALHAAKEARLYAISYGQMAIESSLRDAGSVKYQLKAYNLDNDSLCYSYSALNGFGGRSHGVYVIVDGKSLTSSRAFAQYCAANSNFERY